MRKRQAKKIAKKRAARVKAVIRAAMHRKPTEIFIGECSDRATVTILNTGPCPVPLVPGLVESFNKASGCGVALVRSEQSISDLK